MKLKFVLILLTYFTIKNEAAPLNLDYIEEDPELISGYYEGDMILAEPRNGVIDKMKTWPMGMVFYKIEKHVFDADQISYIEQAMRAIESISCIRFYPAPNNTEDYIMITGSAKGCHATVGYLGRKQTLNLEINTVNRGCFRVGTILHEFLHGLGFYHQHSASNRDEYIQVLTDNIKDNYRQFFRKFKDSIITDFGIGYDYDSVMHYSSKAFTKNGKETIVPLDINAKIGQRVGLSIKDVLKLNLMYKCPMEDTLHRKIEK